MEQAGSDKEKQYFTTRYSFILALSVHPRNSDTLIWTGVLKHAAQINKIIKFCLLERIPFIFAEEPLYLLLSRQWGCFEFGLLETAVIAGTEASCSCGSVKIKNQRK